jgi:hypothetical protein
MTEAEWFGMMDVVVPECRRTLKAKGSAVFVLQPNSERLGSMRPWLWEFMAKWSREWNQVQDAWWWNVGATPTSHCQETVGLMRPSLKASVWLGAHDCFRDQSKVLWTASDSTLADKRADRAMRNGSPSGHSMNHATGLGTFRRRGGVTPFNVIPCGNGDTRGGGAFGHGAATPHEWADWWVRYINPRGGTVGDCFAGSGTIGIAALARGGRTVGIERMGKYFDLAVERHEAALCGRRARRIVDGKPEADKTGDQLPLFSGA